MRRLLAAGLVICMVLAFQSGWAFGYGDNSVERSNTFATGGSISAAIKNDGSLWVWGTNLYVQLGGVEENVSIESPVQNPNEYISISLGENHGAGIKANGELWMWGSNTDGQIGNGRTKATYEGGEAAQKIMDNAAAASLSYGSSFAITKDNVLYAWGSQAFGKLGNGAEQGKATSPVKVMENVKSVSAGRMHTLILTLDNKLYACGSNMSGELGIKTDRNENTTPIFIMDGVAFISAGMAHSAIIKTDGTLWTSGQGSEGQLGDGRDKSSNYSFEKVMDNVKSVATGFDYTMVVKNDATLWSFGQNGFGQLARGQRSYEICPPTQVMEGVAAVSAYNRHTLILKTNGELFGCGSNFYGEVGQGNSYDAHAPVKVLDNVKIPPEPAKPSTPDEPGESAKPEEPPSGLKATPTASTVLVNGEPVAFDAYNINDNNYFKLRDLAYILNDTEKCFEVEWDGEKEAISLTSGQAYTKVGGEMEGKSSDVKTPLPSNAKVYLNGDEVALTAYNIDGNNYFKLRDIGAAFDFGVDWDDAAKTIVIDTSKPYSD